MAKKPKDQVPNANSVPNRDIIQRLNFLYQASTYLDSLPVPVDSTGAKSTKDLSRNYIRSMKIVAQKMTVKMDPTVKRTLCRGCNAVLVPGTTASVRVKPSPSHGHAVTYTCFACKSSRRIPAPPTLHFDPGDPQSLVDGPPQESPPQFIKKKMRKKAPPLPHILPLFARPGHIVLRGNEKLEDENVGQMS